MTTTMVEAIINGTFLLFATLIGSGITILATRNEAKISDLKSQNESARQELVRSLKQIEAYHNLEEMYCCKIAELEQKTPKTVKIEFRDAVVETHQCERPFITANSAVKQIREIT